MRNYSALRHGSPLRERPRFQQLVGVALFLIAWLLPPSAKANEPLAVMFGISRPPYVMEENQTGISVELAREVFARMGRRFVAVFGANKRLEISLKHEQVDVAVEVQPTDSSLYYSAPFIAYRNYVVSRERDDITFRDWPDLAGHSVCAWQNAKENLGPRFAETIPSFSDYREFALQKRQVRQWLKGGCEAILIDDTLLKWWIQDLQRESGIPHEIKPRYAAFPGDNALWWFVGFRDSRLRDEFNRQLSAMQKDGTYLRIRENFLPAL